MKIKETRELPTTSVKEYIIEFRDSTYHYRDYYNEKGKVIDSELINEDGTLNTDQELIEEIQNFIDEEEKF